jgi:hypothetical protein
VKVHKIVLCVVDHDDLGAAEVRVVLENTRYPNHCISPRVIAIDTRDVEWSDDHPLNQQRGALSAFAQLFADKVP